jgi:uncharacterized protein
MKKKLFVILIFLYLAHYSFAADVPRWTGNYVSDYAGVLDNKAELESFLKYLEQNKSVEFAIVTLSSLPADETKETYSYKIFNEWKIGKKTENNGLLFLMIVNQSSGNRMRMEIGYGLEGYITDAAAGRMLDAALPYYEAGNYSQAAYVVVSGISDRLADYQSGYKKSLLDINLFFVLFPLIFMLFAIGISMYASRPRCPVCGSFKLTEKGDYYICDKGHKFRKKKVRSHYNAMVFGTPGGFGGSGGFGGGASGGGGAGR